MVRDGIHNYTTVHESVSTLRADRGLPVLRCICSSQDGPDARVWVRSQLVIVGGIILQSRTLAAVRASPWMMSFVRMCTEDDAHEVSPSERRMCVVEVASPTGEKQLLVVDGGAMLQLPSALHSGASAVMDLSAVINPPASSYTEPQMQLWAAHESVYTSCRSPALGQWELCGVPIDMSTFSKRDGDCLSTFSLPIDGETQLQVVPMEWLQRVVIGVRLPGDDHKCMLIDPNVDFMMIPLTTGS